MTSLALYRGALAARLPGRRPVSVAAVAAVLLGAWFVASLLLAQAGAYNQAPWIGVAAIGALVALLAGTRIPLVVSVLAAPGMTARLAWPQTLRVIGIVFLLVMAQGHLPALFALPAGLGDVAIGIAAILVLRRSARGPERGAGVWFNALGLLDLVVAVSLGFLAMPGPNQVLHVIPSTGALRLLPLALVPSVVVPVAASLHIVSLRRLLSRAAGLMPNGISQPSWTPRSSSCPPTRTPA